MRVERDWQPGDSLLLELPMPPRLLHAALRNVQESRAPDGSPVVQQVLFHPYVALARGPLVYATGLLDGYKSSESLQLPHPPENAVSDIGPATVLEVAVREPATTHAITLHQIERWLASGRF